MALGAAYVAHTTGADTAYYNPANMSFMDAEKRYTEGGITLAHLPSNEYTLMVPYSGESKKENLLLPYLHYVAKPIEDFRWGVSLTVPGGLTKRWHKQPQRSFAEEFTLNIIELNPSASYRVRDDFSVGAGLRVVYSKGKVKSTGQVSRDMDGDTFEFGYNLAMAYKPTSDINVAMTYRSNIDIKEEGNAKLYYGSTLMYDGDSSVKIPLPAAFNAAVSKTWQERFTLEFNYERTFWSKYDTLDFKYGGANIGPLTPYFGIPQVKNWKDSNTYRLGATIKNDKITMMMAFAIDDTPVPVETIGFELPDSDAKIFSMGFRYQQTEKISWGAALLLDSKEPRSIPRGVNENPVLANGGGFSEGGAFLTTIGVAYEY